MKKFIYLLAMILVVINYSVPVYAQSPIFGSACNINHQVGGRAVKSAVCSVGSNASNPFLTLINSVTSLIAYAAGATAVIFLLIGSIKYIASNGDPNSIKSAKNTIIYSLIGIIVIVIARSIIIFALSKT